MQTFMPHGDYVSVARALDSKRLGKQRVETYQIIKALRGEYAKTGAWVNHPASVMWSGHIYDLALYGLTVSIEFYERGYDGWNMCEVFNALTRNLADNNTEQYPWWVNNELLQLTHQSNLVRKDHTKYDYPVPPNIPYIWPLAHTQDFRLGTLKPHDNIALIRNASVYVTIQQIAQLADKPLKELRKSKHLSQPHRVIGNTNLWLLPEISQYLRLHSTPFGGRNV